VVTGLLFAVAIVIVPVLVALGGLALIGVVIAAFADGGLVADRG